MAKRYQPEKAYKQIGLKVRRLREGRGWTLERAEEVGGIDWSQLQKIESGRNITVRMLIRLANMFGVHPSVLFEDI